MITVVKEITVDVGKPIHPIKIPAKQGDMNSRFVLIKITNNGVPVDIDREALVTINAKRLYGDCKVFEGEINDNGVRICLNSWILQYEGIVKCDISIIKDNFRITSFEFYVDVQSSPGSYEEVSDTPEYDLLTQAIANIPSKLPNPEILTINGTEYDGSEAVSVDTREFVISADLSDIIDFNEDMLVCGADVTSDEIKQAYQSGRTIILNYDGSRLSLTTAEESTEVLTLSFVFSIPGACLQCIVIASGGKAVISITQSTFEITIGTESWSGIEPIDFTTTINEMIDEKSKDFETTSFKPSVKSYGAVGDGSTDDTVAFQTALAENRLVYVPEGIYVISDTLTIKENCELELAQSAVINFAQTNKPCISLLRLASLKGNHATIKVPYEFSSNVINASTTDDINNVVDTNLDGNKIDENTLAVPPFTKWDPQWKMSRYVTDINICKTMGDTYLGTYAGFHYSKTGDTAGKAVSMVCRTVDSPISFMWGISMSGVRIAGAFEYGIYINNEDKAWNHDMRIEAVMDGCKTGVYAKNCNTAHIAVSIQPRLASDDKTAYAEHAIHLVNCKWMDISSCFIWDWQLAKSGFKRIAMFGECPGLVVSIPNYYEGTSNISDFIYSDNQNNLNKMTVFQMNGNWFKNEQGVPYFYDGTQNMQLATIEDLETHKITSEQTYFIKEASGEYIDDPNFTNVIDEYQENVWASDNGTIATKEGCILIKMREFSLNDTIRIRGIDFSVNPGRLNYYYKTDGSWKGLFNTAGMITANGQNTGFGYNNEFSYEWDSKTVTLTVTFNADKSASFLNAYLYEIGGMIAPGYTADSVIMTVNEEIEYDKVWQGEPKSLTDDIKVKAENIIGLDIPTDDHINEMIDEKIDSVNDIPYIIGNSTTDGVWTGNYEGITEYYEGLTILYKINVVGVSGGTTLNINELGAIAVKRNISSAVTTTYPVGSIVMLTYSDGAWLTADYDSNTKNTAGTSNKSGTKLYLTGATSQASSATTYSNSKCYIGTNNRLYSNGNVVPNVDEIEALIDAKLGVIENGSY